MYACMRAIGPLRGRIGGGGGGGGREAELEEIANKEAQGARILNFIVVGF
jgi:hypothetical protein